MPPREPVQRRHIPSEKQIARIVPEENPARPLQRWSGLDCEGMHLSQIPQRIFSAYSSITVLYLGHNNLRSITSGISSLRSLQILDVSHNHIQTLSLELCSLLSLRELNLANNEIDHLPVQLAKLFSLQILCLQGNPLNDTTAYYFREGPNALIEHLVEMLPAEESAPRQWIVPAAATPDEAAREPTFTLVDYNILCDKYTSKQIFGWCPSWALSWEFRKEHILQEILKEEPDIITLQEVETSEFYSYFLPNLHQRGYDGIFRPKSRARTMLEHDRTAVDGCATFFNESKFIVRQEHVLEFASLATMKCAGASSMLNRVMPKDNIALLVVLEHRTTGLPLVVVNAHFTWDPQFVDVKLVQALLMMQEVRTFLEASPYSLNVPCLMCGDMNSLPDSGVVEFLQSGHVGLNHPDFGTHDYAKYLTPQTLSHPFKLRSAYTSEMPFTNYTEFFKGIIDYVYYTEKTLTPVAVLGPPSPNSLTYVGCPNPAFPSDHFMLAIKFAVNAQPATFHKRP
eukprot:m.23601 g.23601  ORF g.23601 m.23601 type:complete len:512 (-) comp35294_c0_seq3:59-1594(-)